MGVAEAPAPATLLRLNVGAGPIRHPGEIGVDAFPTEACDVQGDLLVGLPFPDNSFDLVLSINTLHNLPYARLVRALQEMRRVSGGRMFVQVDAYRTPAEKARFEDWVLTAEWAGYPDEWMELFAAAGYDGDYCWTIA